MYIKLVATTLSIMSPFVGAILIWILLDHADISASDLLEPLRRTSPLQVSLIFALLSSHIWLGGEKWRAVESMFGTCPTRWEAFTYGAIASGLGQFLPPPVSNAMIRAGGNYIKSGTGARRGALTSTWKQLFDLYVVLILTVPALIAAYIAPALSFFVLSPLFLLLGEGLIRQLHKIADSLTQDQNPLRNLRNNIFLYRLSVLRYLVLTILTLLISTVSHTGIPPIPLASIIPPVAFATALSMLPAGLGVSEWSFVYFLSHHGVALESSATFGIFNRALQSAAYLTIAALVLILISGRSAKRFLSLLRSKKARAQQT